MTSIAAANAGESFGPGHHFLAEENPTRVVELVVETIREGSLSDARERPVAAGIVIADEPKPHHVRTPHLPNDSGDGPDNEQATASPGHRALQAEAAARGELHAVARLATREHRKSVTVRGGAHDDHRRAVHRDQGVARRLLPVDCENEDKRSSVRE